MSLQQLLQICNKYLTFRFFFFLIFLFFLPWLKNQKKKKKSIHLLTLQLSDDVYTPLKFDHKTKQCHCLHNWLHQKDIVKYFKCLGKISKIYTKQ